MKTKGKLHYAWYILVVCILMNMTVHALVMQVSNLYMVPMSDDLNVPRTLLSLQSVIMAVGAIITAPIWGKFYKKYDARIILSICTLVAGLATIARAFMPNIWCILIVSAVKGISFAGNTVLPNSILLTRWFQKSRGIAVSTVAIGISLGGVIFNPIVESIITASGWRTADIVVGLVMLVIMLPLILFVVRSSPKDKGLLPYGANQAPAVEAKAAANKAKEVYGMSFKEARRSPILWVFLLAVFGMTFAIGAALQISTYLQDVGYTLETAARVGSAYMLVGIFGRILLGRIIDKFGVKKASIYQCIVGMIAFTCVFLAANKAALIAMIVTYGLVSGFPTIMPTLLTSNIFGTRDYGPIYGMVVSVNRFGGVIGNVLVSLLFDITKSSAAVWPVCVAAMVLTLVAILYCMNASKKMMATQQTA